jgi:glutamate racemase
MKLGVFDSGIGGKAVALSLQKSFPSATIITINDSKNVPYGSKTQEHVFELTYTAIQPLLEANCDIIILACNTATAVAIEKLRTLYPEQKFIGLEPMVKTAASLTKTGVITICATPATLSSKRYDTLKQKFAAHLVVLEPDCSDWAYRIENNQMNSAHIKDVIQSVRRSNSDVLVLACTHYHWIQDAIRLAAGDDIEVIEPSAAIARRVSQLLEAHS